MRLAIIDLGTLKVKSLFVEKVVAGGNELEPQFKTLYSSNELTCFGCGMELNGNNVLEKNLESTIEELLRLKKLLQEYKIDKYKVISTNALRKANNREYLLQRIKEKTGFEIDNISQEEEASLFFDSVIKNVKEEFSHKRYIIVDIGGGSVQILVGSKDKGIEDKYLMQTGAQYLHDNFTKSSSKANSKTTNKDLNLMQEYIKSKMGDIKRIEGSGVVYGSSNIIDLFENIKIEKNPSAEIYNHPFLIESKEIKKFLKGIIKFDYQTRESMYPFQHGYMWGIDKAFLNILLISEYFNCPNIIPSNQNIANGLVYKLSD